jgi:hypothetical protein
MDQKEPKITLREIVTAIVTFAAMSIGEGYLLNLHSLWYWPFLVLAEGVILFAGALYVLRVRRFLKPYMIASISAAVYVMYLVERGLLDAIVSVVNSGALLTVPGLVLFFYPSGLLAGLIYLQVALGKFSVYVVESEKYE